jgi:hypothetical protein
MRGIVLLGIVLTIDTRLSESDYFECGIQSVRAKSPSATYENANTFSDIEENTHILYRYSPLCLVG